MRHRTLLSCARVAVVVGSEAPPSGVTARAHRLSRKMWIRVVSVFYVAFAAFRSYGSVLGWFVRSVSGVLPNSIRACDPPRRALSEASRGGLALMVSVARQSARGHRVNTSCFLNWVTHVFPTGLTRMLCSLVLSVV